MSKPQTLQEWQKYVKGLDDRDLFEIAVAAGSTKFMRALLGEGYPADDITEIQKMFAVQFKKRDIEPPSRAPGCIVDFRSLAR
jgi:hypothetical protein